MLARISNQMLSKVWDEFKPLVISILTSGTILCDVFEILYIYFRFCLELIRLLTSNKGYK